MSGRRGPDRPERRRVGRTALILGVVAVIIYAGFILLVVVNAR